MSWLEVQTMTLRFEFVMFAQREGVNFSELCECYNISRKTGYKWLRRFIEAGDAGLLDVSRRPHSSPSRTEASMEAAVLELRDKHPAWGGRKLHQVLKDDGLSKVPAPSTITAILHRANKVDTEESAKRGAFTRFEHPNPNDLWQMDFKGHFATRQGRCHPLTVLDDHARFSVLVDACADEKTETVKRALIKTFRRYGLPRRMTMDNGSPWGSDALHELTVLTAWLIRLGIAVSHSRPYHPQTQGKDERFHRTLAVEAIKGREFHDVGHSQRVFDEFREIYNFRRPHEALGMKVPASRYQPSNRQYPEALPPIEYAPGDEIRKVQAEGLISFKGRTLKVSKALRGYPIALRPTGIDGTYSVHFCHQKVKEISLR